jgi:phosphopantetheinyl transferase (holo-ACP synthase)
MFEYLTDDMIDIYYATLPAAFKGMDKYPSWMSPLDIRISQGCKSVNRQKELIYGRFILKHVLAYNIRTDPAKIFLRKSRYGKLHLYKNNRNIHFSVSHSKNKLICAFFRDYHIGVDVEYKKRNFVNVARSFFSTKEKEFLSQVPDHQRNDTACMLWTRKEAYVKTKGKGILIPFDSFNVINGGKAVFKTLELDDDFLLSIAVITNDASDIKVRLLQISLTDTI